MSPRRRGRRGFTVLELVVTFAILILALLLGGRLLIESQRQLARSAERQRAIPPELFVEQLRIDAAGAAALAGAGSGWRETPLELVRHGGGRVRYEIAEDALWRELRPGVAAPPTGRRPVLLEVERWRWRARPGAVRPLLEVEVTWREPPLITSTRRGGPPRLRQRSVKIALRAAGGSRW